MVSSMIVTHCSSIITKSGLALVSRMLDGIVDGGLSTTLSVGRSGNSLVCVDKLFFSP